MLGRIKEWWKIRQQRKIQRLAKLVVREILERDAHDAAIIEKYVTERLDDERQRRLAAGDLGMIPQPRQGRI